MALVTQWGAQNFPFSKIGGADQDNRLKGGGGG